MKTITRTFQTAKAAERFQNRLYDRFDTVRLINWPLFGEAGIYVWDVK